MTTTKLVKARRSNLADELEHSANVDLRISDADTALEDARETLRNLVYEVSRNGGDETALDQSRQIVRDLERDHSELWGLRSRSEEAVTQKTEALRLAEFDQDQASWMEIRKARSPKAKKVMKLAAGLKKAIYDLDADDHAEVEFAEKVGLTSEQANQASRRDYVGKWLGAQLEHFLELESRPHQIFRETSLAEIEDDKTRVIEQDLKRARRRIENHPSNGKSDG